MTTITIDLGPGNLANPEYSPFKIPLMYWEELGGFLEAPLLLKPASVDSISTALKWMGEGKLSILAFRTSASQWFSFDKPYLINVAKEIIQLGNSTIPTSIAAMQKESPKFKSGQYTPGDVQKFNAILQQLANQVNPISSTCKVLETDMALIDHFIENGQTFVKAAEKYMNTIAPDPSDVPKESAQNIETYNDLVRFKYSMDGSNLSIAHQQLGYIRGTMSNITAEVQNAIENINKTSYNKNPFEIQDDFNVDIQTWKTVAADAKSFLEGMG